jgi:multicomponent Na+:H+ antiporter subunit D
LVGPLLGLWHRGLVFPFAVAAITAAAAASALALALTIEGRQFHYYMGGWPPPLGIEYLVDRVAAFAATVLLCVALPVIIATRRLALSEFGDRLGFFYGLILMMLAGITGMIVTHDLFNLFIFTEIGSLAAYALVFMGGPRGMIAGFRYLMLGSIGGGFFLIGVGFLYFATGSLNMTDLSSRLVGLEDSRAVLAGAVFIFTGLGLKMALFPLHIWLPDAYTYAPSSVNTLMAPLMTKAAAIAMLRMFLSVFPEGYLTEVVPVSNVLLILGLAGMIIGSLAAVSQPDFRRLLAYSSVGQLGIIGVGIGLATPLGFAAALLHIMNHAIMKGCLFLVAASVRFRTGRTDVDGMSGLGRSMPATMAALSIAALSMVGVPPLAGFFSKLYLAQAGFGQGNWVVVAAVLASSLLTATYLFRVIERAYLPERRGNSLVEHSVMPPGESATSHQIPAQAPAKLTHEAPLDMVLPTLLLAIAGAVVGVGNAAILTYVLEPGIASWVP